MVYGDIIVGAGSSGAVLAARLSEDRARDVLLLEAGPDFDTPESTPKDLLDGKNMPVVEHDWQFTAEAVPGRTIRYPRGKTTGGSSAVNATVALRGVPADYDEWAAWGNDEWAWEKVLPYFRRLEDDQDEGGDLHGKGGPIFIRRWKPDELLPFSRAAMTVFRRLGYDEVSDHNHPDSTGYGPIQMNQRDGVRISTAIAYLLPARHRLNLTIRAHCLVNRVLFEGRRAVGVEVECGGVVQQVFGRRITLSAGAVASPAILLRSGIGPSDDLRTTTPGSDEFNDMQIYVGNHLDVAALDPAAAETIGASIIFGLWASLQRPRSRGRLTLASADPHVQPKLDLNYFADPADLRRMAEGLRLCWKAAQAPGITALSKRVAILTDEMMASDEVVQEVVKDTAGTTKMGPAADPAAVVDQYCRVRGVDNLRVVDASVMPNIPRANTNLTCIMIGERVADWMRAEP